MRADPRLEQMEEVVLSIKRADAKHPLVGQAPSGARRRSRIFHLDRNPRRQRRASQVLRNICICIPRERRTPQRRPGLNRNRQKHRRCINLVRVVPVLGLRQPEQFPRPRSRNRLIISRPRQRKRIDIRRAEHVTCAPGNRPVKPRPVPKIKVRLHQRHPEMCKNPRLSRNNTRVNLIVIRADHTYISNVRSRDHVLRSPGQAATGKEYLNRFAPTTMVSFPIVNPKGLAMPKAVTIATMNLLNLAALDQITYRGAVPISAATYERKIQWIADKLTVIDADIIGFQEVWSRDALVACFDRAGLTDKYQIIARDAPFGRVQTAAAISTKLPITNDPSTHWTEEFPKEARFIKRKPKPGEQMNQMELKITQFSRPILNLDLDMGLHLGEPLKLRLFVMHLKSKLAMELDSAEYHDPAVKPHAKAIGEALSAIRRTAEVAALRVWLNKELRETRMPSIVVGDMNDGHLSTTAGILAAQPPQKLFAASRVGQKATKSGDVGLYSAQMLQEYRSIRDVYYTYEHENLLESLDHIFVSEEFYEHSPNCIWTFHDLKVLNDHIHFRSSTDKVQSDHGIIVAKFDAKKPAPVV